MISLNRCILYDDKTEECVTGTIYSITCEDMSPAHLPRLTLDVVLDPYAGNVSNEKLAKEVANLIQKKEDLTQEIANLEAKLAGLYKEPVGVTENKEYDWRYE